MDYAYTLEEGQFLVRLARTTLTTYLQTRKKPTIPEDTPPKLKSKSGVFVTLNKFNKALTSHELRGCIGRPYPEQLLVQATIDSTIDAGTRDPRFDSVDSIELDRIQFEVTALTPPIQIQAKNTQDLMDQIEIGRDGLILETHGPYGFGVGLFLPQVPIEWQWDKEEYLNELCGKAGVSPRAWKDLKVTKISKFMGEIFKEEIPKGAIIREELKVPKDEEDEE